MCHTSGCRQSLKLVAAVAVWVAVSARVNRLFVAAIRANDSAAIILFLQWKRRYSENCVSRSPRSKPMAPSCNV